MQKERGSEIVYQYSTRLVFSLMIHRFPPSIKPNSIIQARPLVFHAHFNVLRIDRRDSPFAFMERQLFSCGCVAVARSIQIHAGSLATWETHVANNSPIFRFHTKMRQDTALDGDVIFASFQPVSEDWVHCELCV